MFSILCNYEILLISQNSKFPIVSDELFSVWKYGILNSTYCTVSQCEIREAPSGHSSSFGPLRLIPYPSAGSLDQVHEVF